MWTLSLASQLTVTVSVALNLRNYYYHYIPLLAGWFNECSETLNENEIARTRLEESPEEKRRDRMMLALSLGIMQLPSLVVIASTDDNYDNRPLRDALHLPFRGGSFIASSHHLCIILLFSSI